MVIDQVVWGCVWNASYIFLMNLATDSPGFGKPTSPPSPPLPSPHEIEKKDKEIEN